MKYKIEIIQKYNSAKFGSKYEPLTILTGNNVKVALEQELKELLAHSHELGPGDTMGLELKIKCVK